MGQQLTDRLRRMLGASVSSSDDSVSFDEATHRILFVCMGNICRSPTAEGVFRSVLKAHAPELSVFVDSAGTHAYHIGSPPDPRACSAAERRGVSLSALRARKIAAEDFERFDIILAMDRLNVAVLTEQSEPEFHDRIQLFLDYAPRLEQAEVPDPYYGGASGFEHVLDLIEEASLALVEHLRRHT